MYHRRQRGRACGGQRSGEGRLDEGGRWVGGTGCAVAVQQRSKGRGGGGARGGVVIRFVAGAGPGRAGGRGSTSADKGCAGQLGGGWSTGGSSASMGGITSEQAARLTSHSTATASLLHRRHRLANHLLQLQLVRC